jgi:hypothetical protein
MGMITHFLETLADDRWYNLASIIQRIRNVLHDNRQWTNFCHISQEVLVQSSPLVFQMSTLSSEVVDLASASP